MVLKSRRFLSQQVFIFLLMVAFASIPQVVWAFCGKSNLLIMIDHSGSMSKNDKWKSAEKGINVITAKYGQSLRFGLEVFANSPKIVAGIPASSSAIKNALTRTKLIGDTYMVTAIATARAHLISALSADTSKGRPTSIILITDGSPSDRCPQKEVNALRKLNLNGTVYDVKTYVIGFGVNVNPNCLNNLAVAGGTALPGAIKYYISTTKNQDTFETIAKKIASSVDKEICNGKDDDCDGKVDNIKNSASALTRDCLVGRCDGLQSCSNGTWLSCKPKSSPKPEVCDGKDNNCDGYIDNQSGSKANNTLEQSCNTTCGKGKQLCALGNWSSCNAPSSKPETCNGKDDDCDGKIDNINGKSDPLSESCATAGCTGERLCISAKWGTCKPKSKPTPETCNGKDDDCDGFIDNKKGIKKENTLTQTCTGSCGLGQEVCSSGKWGACSAQPTKEVCDGKDNDCDGNIDNIKGTGTPLTISCQVGRCAAAQFCRRGKYTKCAPLQAPGPESCNGRDDDCDGYIDNQKGVKRHYSLYRPCKGKCGNGRQRCYAARWQACSTAPKKERCNNRDDDCDGFIDNQQGVKRAHTLRGNCKKGACPGTRVCNQGRWLGCSPYSPRKESCNGRDDDCDGSIDEGLSRGCKTKCGTGTETCHSGTWRSCSAKRPAKESCNNQDDDCDGSVDEGLARICGTCGTQTCLKGSWGTCSKKPPTAETCNNRDDDCDGFIDNAKNASSHYTLTRSCKNKCGSGVETCVSGNWKNCTARVQAELCDGKDNDCDGKVDENWDFYLKPSPKACKKQCQVGVYACKPDKTDVFCNAPAVTPEVCDGKDNDCNGLVDEGWPQKGKICFAGSGACQKTGLFICKKDGRGIECSAKAPITPGKEVCDGIDNNCDGVTDEGLERDCSTSCGKGKSVCQEGSWTVCSAIVPKKEICDGKDNDCDGKTDEDFPQLNKSCRVGKGLCLRTGLYVCLANKSGVECDVLPGKPSKEVCDAKDNDCDGKVDEGCKCKTGETRACGLAVGACKQGKQVCKDGQWSSLCKGEVKRKPEVCDGKDNDCDGLIDEDFANLAKACSVGKGACRRQGTFKCRTDGKGIQCDAKALQPKTEICDKKDNDCDGKIDDIKPRPCNTKCGSGIQFCTNGQWDKCSVRKPKPETCDGKDNDCDGKVDELKPRPCNTKCGSGTERCVGGKWAFCDARKPTDEVCDGKDNNCDGSVDEGLKPIPCSGACGQGTAICKNGKRTGCSGPQPKPEVCDGKDNDCNGKTDDMKPRSCRTRCGEGTETCKAARWQGCTAIKVNKEVCDGKDNDCDGKIDNNATCPNNNAVCIQGGCRQHCSAGECPKGQECRNNRCFSVSCKGVKCPDGKVCKRGACISPCQGVTCPDGQVCRDGKCFEKNCYAFGCQKGEICIDGKCRPDDCKNINCSSGQFCYKGNCVSACKGCPPGRRCKGGHWVPAPCSLVSCASEQVCENGKCAQDLCLNITCPTGRICAKGQCEHDPCFSITCPSNTTCHSGECVEKKLVCPSDVLPDGEVSTENSNPEEVNAEFRDGGEQEPHDSIGTENKGETSLESDERGKRYLSGGCGCTSSQEPQQAFFYIFLLFFCLSLIFRVRKKKA